MIPLTQTQAAAAFRSNDAAFAELVAQFQGPLFNFCYRLLGAAAEAEDAAQDTFLRAFQHRARYDPRRPVRAWLMAIAAHGCIDRLRRRRLTWLPLDEERLADHPALQHPGPGPEAQVLAAEQHRDLQQQLARLTPGDQQVLVLYYWGSLSYAEIAAATGSSLPAIKSRLHRARTRLAELLRQPPLRAARPSRPALPLRPTTR